jgi:hypothetical protein
MATLSGKKLALIEEELRPSLCEDDLLMVLTTIRAHLDLDTHLEKQRVLQRRASERLREAGQSTYSHTDRSYYERNKAMLNKKRTELNREKRARAKAEAEAAASENAGDVSS